MAETVNQTKNEERRSWKDRLRERQPDINVDDELAVGDYLGDTFSSYDKVSGQQKQFNDLLSTDPNSAGIISGMATGLDENGEPFSLAGYLVEKYGDIVREAASEEEAVQKAKEREAEQIKQEAEKTKRSKEWNDNLAVTDQALTQAAQKANVDEATVSNMLEWLYGKKEDKESEGLIHRIVSNTLDENDWAQLLFAFNRDASLSSAREEGRKTGVRSRPGAAHRQLTEEGVTDLGASGGGEMPAEEETDPTLKRYARMGRRF